MRYDIYIYIYIYIYMSLGGLRLIEERSCSAYFARLNIIGACMTVKRRDAKTTTELHKQTTVSAVLQK